jgi:hypothetical protein
MPSATAEDAHNDERDDEPPISKKEPSTSSPKKNKAKKKKDDDDDDDDDKKKSSSPKSTKKSSSPKQMSSPEPISYLAKGDEDEGLLKDVLEELDRERSQRAELEANVRKLQLQVQKYKSAEVEKDKNTHSNSTEKQQQQFTRLDYLALQAEKDGYLELIDAILKERPAFSQSSLQQSMPIHVLRLLEVMPYDARAKPYLFGKETLYEWQIWTANRTWATELKRFPTFFKTLPIVSPAPGRTVGESPSPSSPPRNCVLTNEQVSHILNIGKGFPLPQDGGFWQWIGGWRIEKTMDTDDQGWSYSNDLDALSHSSYFSEHRAPKKGERQMSKRRRKWTRVRALVDYPNASTMTQEYLKLMAEKASLQVTVEKLSAQLVETKISLTGLEAEHHEVAETSKCKIRELEKELKEKNEILSAFEGVAPSNIGSTDQIKELKSLVSMWVSENLTKIGDGNGNENGADQAAAAAAAADGSNNKLFSDWTKGGNLFLDKIRTTGGQHIEKIKQQGEQGIGRIKEKGSSSFPWQRSQQAPSESASEKSSVKEDTAKRLEP